MYRLLVIDVKRSIFNYGFFVGCILLTFILLRSIIPYFSNSNMYPVLEICAIPMALSGFTVFAAAFPAWAYSGRYFMEKKTGYSYFIRSRISLKKYIIIRIFTVAFSGGLIIAIPLAITFFCSFFLGINEVGSLFYGSKIYDSIINYGIPIILLIKDGLGFLYGAFWSLVAFYISLITKEYYVILLVPFISHQFLWIFLKDYPKLNPICLVRGEDIDSYGLSAVILFLYCCLASLCIFFRIYWQETKQK